MPAKPPPAGEASLTVLVRQHARTAQLMGVDFVPAYRTNSAAPMASAGTSSVESTEPAPAAPSISSPSAGGTDRASAQARLDAIRARYEADAPHAKFITSFNKIVFGEGDPCARLMFIGEAPGADEDKVGKPFVGRAGQLLEKMIVAMGLTRQQVYIANVLKTRPPNNATPTLEEAQLCAPYLYDQVVAVSPLVIVTLGLPATRLVLGTDLSMSALRGRWASFTHKGFTVPVMPTYHPAFLLRSYTPENRGKVWSDLQQAMSKLGVAVTTEPGEG